MNNIKKQSLWDGSSAGLPTMNGVGESRTSASMSGQSGTYGHCQRNGNIIYSTEASTIQSTCCANPTVACTTTSVQRHQSAERPILHQISSFMYPKIQQRQVIINVLHPSCARLPRWLPPVLWRRFIDGLASICVSHSFVQDDQRK